MLADGVPVILAPALAAALSVRTRRPFMLIVLSAFLVTLCDAYTCVA